MQANPFGANDAAYPTLIFTTEGSISDMGETRYIPEEIKRNVRRKCFFGCIVCGCPLIEYHHIHKFSDGGPNSVENLVLLCKPHHHAVTHGHMPEDFISRYIARPVNAERDYTTNTTAAYFSGDEGEFDLDGFCIKFQFDRDGYGVGLSIDGAPILSLTKQDGQLLLGMVLYEPGMGKVFEVVRSELVVNTGVWDYTFVAGVSELKSDRLGEKLRIAAKRNKVEFGPGTLHGPRNSLSFKNGELFINGKRRFGGFTTVNMGFHF